MLALPQGARAAQLGCYDHLLARILDPLLSTHNRLNHNKESNAAQAESQKLPASSTGSSRGVENSTTSNSMVGVNTTMLTAICIVSGACC